MSTGEWILITLAGLTAPFLVAALIGWFLPRDHRASRSVVIHQAPTTIFETVSHLERLPSWWMMVRGVEMLPDRGGGTRYRQTFANRRRDLTIDMEVVESHSPSRFVTRIADERSPFQGRWTYEIEPVEAGSQVTVTEEGTITHPLIRFFFRTMMSKSHTIDSYLRALGQKFGEKVEPA
jgi:uncharacterized protein YndB with AHSA1/START domain